MIVLDHALERRVRDGNPIRVAIVGAGFSGRTVAYQIIQGFPGMRLVAISNRTLDSARDAYRRAGVMDTVRVTEPPELERAMESGKYAVTTDPSVLWKTAGVEAIIEATGTIEFGSHIVLNAVQQGKNVIMLNAELDATLGPVLKSYADRTGALISNTDGDEPGAAMNLIRFVRTIGLDPMVAGNLKGLYDRYRTPKTQEAFAAQHNQKAQAVTSFVDGTKLSMELTVLANASGCGVGKRGMHGPALGHVMDSGKYFCDKLVDGGMVDYLVGAEPSNGVFVVGYTEDPVREEYLRYLKMGEGPLYVFYRPFHLPHLEIPLTVARAVLLGEALVTPRGAPVCDSIAVAKRDLRAGEMLDGLGGFTCYALIENFQSSREIDAVPIGVSDGCRLVRDVPKDEVVTYDCVELPGGRLCDRLRAEMESAHPASDVSPCR